MSKPSAARSGNTAATPGTLPTTAGTARTRRRTGPARARRRGGAPASSRHRAGRGPTGRAPRPATRPPCPRRRAPALRTALRRGRPARRRPCGRARRASSRTGRPRPRSGAPRARARRARWCASKRSLPFGSSAASRQRRVPAGRNRTTRADLVVAVAEDRRGDRHRVPEARLDRKSAAVDLRLDILNLDSWRRHHRQGKQSGDVAHPFDRRQPPSDLSAGWPARARGVRVRRLARRRRSPVLAGPAAQSARRLRLSLRVCLGVCGLAGAPGRSRRGGRALGAAPVRARRTRTGSATGSAFAGATRWPSRCGSTASGRRSAPTPPSGTSG